MGQCWDSESCVSVWTVGAVSVCGQLELGQCVDSERRVSAWTVSAGSVFVW